VLALLAVLAALLVALLVGSAIPHRRRPQVRAALVWCVASLPIVGVIVAIASWEGASLGSYTVLVPVIVTYCCIIDARYGLSHRFARVGPRR